MSHEAVTLRNGKCAGVFETCGETSIIAERLPRPQAGDAMPLRALTTSRESVRHEIAR